MRLLQLRLNLSRFSNNEIEPNNSPFYFKGKLKFIVQLVKSKSLKIVNLRKFSLFLKEKTKIEKEGKENERKKSFGVFPSSRKWVVLWGYFISYHHRPNIDW